MEKCYMLFRDDKVYIKSSKSSKVAEYTIEDAITYPNVPLYFNIFTNEKIIKNIKMFIKKNTDINSFMQGIFGKEVFLLMPDDVTSVTDIERLAFAEFAKRLVGGKTAFLASECAFVAPFEEKQHICISKTCRMMILTYIKDKNIFKQKFIENKEYSSDELYANIIELYGSTAGIPRIYLNGANLSQYSDLGIKINSLDLINNFSNILDMIKIK
jgi:hypothetical protein